MSVLHGWSHQMDEVLVTDYLSEPLELKRVIQVPTSSVSLDKLV